MRLLSRKCVHDGGCCQHSDPEARHRSVHLKRFCSPRQLMRVALLPLVSHGHTVPTLSCIVPGLQLTQRRQCQQLILCRRQTHRVQLSVRAGACVLNKQVCRARCKHTPAAKCRLLKSYPTPGTARCVGHVGWSGTICVLAVAGWHHTQNNAPATASSPTSCMNPSARMRLMCLLARGRPTEGDMVHNSEHNHAVAWQAKGLGRHTAGGACLPVRRF